MLTVDTAGLVIDLRQIFVKVQPSRHRRKGARNYVSRIQKGVDLFRDQWSEVSSLRRNPQASSADGREEVPS